MKVSSPVGEYPYEIRRVRLRGATVVVEGAMGSWDTSMEVEPSDWLDLARRAAVPVAAAAVAVALARRAFA